MFTQQYETVRWVAPFRNPWIKAYSQLPMAYRRVSRLSSPLTAKAFTKRPSRAWFDPEKERLNWLLVASRQFEVSASNMSTQLVTKGALILVSKVYFFPPACFVACWQLNSHHCSWSVRNMNDAVLVSVLDLDNSVCFSRDTLNGARKHSRWRLLIG